MKKESYWKGLEIADMADWLGVVLWGNTPQGDLRIGSHHDSQPTGVLTYEELKARFNESFRVVPVRKMSGYVRVERNP
jgi:hypothetical protein